MIGRATYGRPWIFREVRHYLTTGEVLPQPTVVERVEIAKRHLRKSVEIKGEYVGVLEMRRHLSNYFKGAARFQTDPSATRHADRHSRADGHARLDRRALGRFRHLAGSARAAVARTVTPLRKRLSLAEQFPTSLRRPQESRGGLFFHRRTAPRRPAFPLRPHCPTIRPPCSSTGRKTPKSLNARARCSGASTSGTILVGDQVLVERRQQVRAPAPFGRSPNSRAADTPARRTIREATPRPAPRHRGGPARRATPTTRRNRRTSPENGCGNNEAPAGPTPPLPADRPPAAPVPPTAHR